ncbi:hypothetical protein [Mangrovibacillus cuniculi]|uniref:Bacterial Ig domain-containing protein n=1 Tax=Mangrovibacillus cuniculi TaxID=2593652 RepID=A0A7S8CAI4_9BACI|nr:hypothetical protein [Mangrovibacillus cuniculi]QPC46228.1 hypothetical protein G8O30_04275 [Mangrovibacillus cuniculi]
MMKKILSISIFCLLLIIGSISPVSAKSPNTFTVNHLVQQQDVYVDCYVEGVTLSGLGKGKKAKAVVSIDGIVVGQFHQAAFILKDVSKGEHILTVEIKERTGKSLGMKKDLPISVQ